MILWLGLFIVVVIFAATALIGAPYVPTHRASITKALDMLALNPGETVVDLGSGDGAFLAAAAKRGYVAVGYEINPFLVVVSTLRCLPNHRLVKVMWQNFWRAKLPPNTKAIFVFSAGPYLQKLVKTLNKLASNRTDELQVISYGFELPGLKLKKSKNGLHLYALLPGKR